MSDFEHVFESPPEGAAADWTIPQDWAAYSAVEHGTWDTLYGRQMKILPGRACDVFLQGLKALDLNTGGIPDFAVMNPKLQALTGWTVVCVPGLVPDEVFFDQLDYLQEPDIFHDVFGHVPMLTDPDFAAYMEAYGKGGQRAASLGTLQNLARLYWYTVEFGLMEDADGLRIYGAGIVSSATESVFSLEDPSPNRLGFELERVMRTLYRIDDFQQVYFVIESIEALKAETLKDFGPIYQRLIGEDAIPIEAVLPGDRIFTRGTQAYAARGGRFAA
jgi:phenylalanine-4-hydroxylase